MSLVNLKTIKKYYQMDLKIEMKSKPKQETSKGKAKSKDNRDQTRLSG